MIQGSHSMKRFFLLFAAATISGLIAGCSNDNQTSTTNPGREAILHSENVPDSISHQTFGSEPGGIYLFGGPGGKTAGSPGSGGIAVNSYLWRATLDSISFMPLASADPFGGVIITDWFAPPETPDERFKITIYVLDRDLRADGVRAAVFKQRRDAGGNWIDTQVDPKTDTDLENAILTRARQLRLASSAP
jgi:hypothetical protein